MGIEKPNRKKHSYEQHLVASPEKVFPLLCPVMEEKWVPGWRTEKVFTKTGVVENDCMFITPSESQNSIWIVTKHDPITFQLEMYKVTPEHTISKLEISLSGEGNNATKAKISYEITAIGSVGEQFLMEFTNKWYVNFMEDWEKEMNHYLSTGKKIA